VNKAAPAPASHTDSLTDVCGLRVGHHTDARRPTGVTVVLTPEGAVAGVDVRGAAPGTRETELLSPLNAVEKVHAVMLAGGSAFGLDAAGGVMRWLDERGHGVQVGPARVPIVPAAILFDLWIGDPTSRRCRLGLRRLRGRERGTGRARQRRRRHGLQRRQAFRHRARDARGARQRVGHSRRHHGRRAGRGQRDR